jgi:predicted dehydrogenase
MLDLTRRDFIKTASIAAAPIAMRGPLFGADAPSNKINIAVIGLGGRGAANLGGVKDQNIVALCDVDDVRAGKAYDAHPNAKKFYDFRQMFDEMEKQIDAVVISTPDHTHFHPASWAMQRGKHVYLEKPMAHNLWEVRTLTELAAKKKLATQLGAQRHTMEGLRNGVEIVKSGVLGKIKEVHSWISSARGMPTPSTGAMKIPDTLKWDLWLGPVASRPYTKDVCPYSWRFWWDFGTGEAGNWGCHILDIPFWALDLKYPTRVSGKGPQPDPQRTPKEMATQLEFPATDTRPAVTLHWYQGTPAILKEQKLDAGGMNNLFIGAEGMLLCGFNNFRLLPAEKFKGHQVVKTFPKSPGFYTEWFNAIRGGAAATCHFDYSGPMAETVLLANIAYRVQGAFEWDAANLKIKGNPQAEKLIKEEYRKGWEV